ncbi:MAG: hypothetical protein JNK47_06020 [Mesorhizobium sp.]|nr:DUF6665 family protein [Mesorhizobium sp.]MBL8576761.1 hypothetical protein [Mesorhizobium sp.]
MSSMWPGLPADSGLDLLGHEILAEKAAALGKAGEKARLALARLREIPREDEGREAALKVAAAAVHAYFIQRELCGFRRHESIIREYDIPRAVLVRMGAA